MRPPHDPLVRAAFIADGGLFTASQSLGQVLSGYRSPSQLFRLEDFILLNIKKP